MSGIGTTNPDISGLGVRLAFYLPSFLSIITSGYIAAKTHLSFDPDPTSPSPSSHPHSLTLGSTLSPRQYFIFWSTRFRPFTKKSRKTTHQYLLLIKSSVAQSNPFFAPEDHEFQVSVFLSGAALMLSAFIALLNNTGINPFDNALVLTFALITHFTTTEASAIFPPRRKTITYFVLALTNLFGWCITFLLVLLFTPILREQDESGASAAILRKNPTSTQPVHTIAPYWIVGRIGRHLANYQSRSVAIFLLILVAFVFMTFIYCLAFGTLSLCLGWVAASAMFWIIRGVGRITRRFRNRSQHHNPTVLESFNEKLTHSATPKQEHPTAQPNPTSFSPPPPKAKSKPLRLSQRLIFWSFVLGYTLPIIYLIISVEVTILLNLIGPREIIRWSYGQSISLLNGLITVVMYLYQIAEARRKRRQGIDGKSRKRIKLTSEGEEDGEADEGESDGDNEEDNEQASRRLGPIA